MDIIVLYKTQSMNCFNGLCWTSHQTFRVCVAVLFLNTVDENEPFGPLLCLTVVANVLRSKSNI